MGNAVGAFSKAAFRIESDQGLVNATYPTTVAKADTEEDKRPIKYNPSLCGKMMLKRTKKVTPQTGK